LPIANAKLKQVWNDVDKSTVMTARKCPH